MVRVAMGGGASSCMILEKLEDKNSRASHMYHSLNLSLHVEEDLKNSHTLSLMLQLRTQGVRRR